MESNLAELKMSTQNITKLIESANRSPSAAFHSRHIYEPPTRGGVSHLMHELSTSVPVIKIKVKLFDRDIWFKDPIF